MLIKEEVDYSFALNFTGEGGVIILHFSQLFTLDSISWYPPHSMEISKYHLPPNFIIDPPTPYFKQKKFGSKQNSLDVNKSEFKMSKAFTSLSPSLFELSFVMCFYSLSENM